MKKLSKFLLLFALVGTIGCSSSVDFDGPVPEPEPEWMGDFDSIRLEGINYPIYNLVETAVEPGVEYKFLRVRNPNLRLTAHIIEIDQSVSGLEIRPFTSNSITTRQPIDTIRKQKAVRKGFETIAFFNGGHMIEGGSGSTSTMPGVEMIDGKVVKTTTEQGQMVIGFAKDKKIYVGEVDKIDLKIAAGGQTLDIDSVNSLIRNDNQLILFTDELGRATGTDSKGRELILKPKDGTDWGDQLDYSKVVFSATDGKLLSDSGGRNVPKGSIVLSAHGSALTSFLTPHKDKEFTLTNTGLTTLKDGTQFDAKHLIPIRNLVMQDGETVQFDTTVDDQVMIRTARTAIGYTKDANKVCIVMIEGAANLQRSQGLNMTELSDFFKHIGMTEVVNMDGGKFSRFMMQDEMLGYQDSHTQAPIMTAIGLVRAAKPEVGE